MKRSPGLYPKYDETIWFRACKEEVVDPINGKIQGGYLFIFS